MAKTRLELHNILCEILGSDNCYFQPPASLQLEYPCIIYSIDKVHPVKADNKLYFYNNKYTITWIGKQAICPIIEDMLNLQMCTHDRNYKADGLNHAVFTLYF